MSYYECKRCNHKFKFKNDIRRHIDRSVKCTRTVESYKFTDEELYNMSLIINKSNDIKYSCANCNKVFGRKDNLNRHLLKCNNKCDENNPNPYNQTTIKSDKNIASDNNNIKESHNTHTSESHNNTNTSESHNTTSTQSHNNETDNSNKNIGDDNISGENNTIAHEHSNIINGDQNSITINNYMVLPFDDKWSTTHIDKYFKVFLLNTYRKYTNFIEKVLDNDDNLNVIIDENSDKSLVYKNNIEKYVTMKNKEILEKTMEKANKQLSDIFDEVIETEVISNRSKENLKKRRRILVINIWIILNLIL